ncbi:MAG: nucleoside deaminase [Candidatus Omnitrophica bacterium]|nr:nucleoside deaminase [Candidatus Omnitrophota bacterium]
MVSCHEQFMRLAVSKAELGIGRGQTPFGACIVRNEKVIACQHNLVWQDIDITAHAEIAAIREACRKLNSIDLSGCTIYSTTEPCPMCFTAIHWAKISRIVYGTSIEDAKRFGFSELLISNSDMKRSGNSDIEIIPGCLESECLRLFEISKSKPY